MDGGGAIFVVVAMVVMMLFLFIKQYNHDARKATPYDKNTWYRNGGMILLPVGSTSIVLSLVVVYYGIAPCERVMIPVVAAVTMLWLSVTLHSFFIHYYINEF